MNSNIPKVIVHPFERDISIIKSQNIHYLPFDSNYSFNSTIEQLPDSVQSKAPSRENNILLKTVNNLISESCQKIELNINKSIERSNDSNYSNNNQTNIDQQILQNRSNTININDLHISGEKTYSTNYAPHQLNDQATNLTNNYVDSQLHNEKQIIEGLKEELKVQLKVNSDLKKLLVASIGDDLQHKVDALVRTKVQLSDEIDDYTNKLFDDYETLDKVTIQADLWHSKYQATQLLVEKLTNELNIQSNWKSTAESALIDSLNERQILTDLLFQTYSQLQLMHLHIGLPQQINAHFKTLIHLARSNYNIIRSYVSNLIGYCGELVNGNLNLSFADHTGNGKLHNRHVQSICHSSFNQADSSIYNNNCIKQENEALNLKLINIETFSNISNRNLINDSIQISNIPNLLSDNNYYNIKEINKRAGLNFNVPKLTVGLTSSEMLAHELLEPEILEKCQYIPPLTNKKIIPRFHVETKYFGITYDCCPKCKGEIFSL